MIRKNPRGDLPQIHESAYVDQTAIICGKVIIEENVFVGPYAVIRADEVNAAGDLEPIRIRAHSNIQDGVVIHSKSGALVDIGEHTSIAHRSIVHETETGYAQCFREDAINPRMGLIALDDIKFSEAIRNAWPDPELFDKLKRGERFANPLRV